MDDIVIHMIIIADFYYDQNNWGDFNLFLNKGVHCWPHVPVSLFVVGLLLDGVSI